jgi:hypothetical protein
MTMSARLGLGILALAAGVGLAANARAAEKADEKSSDTGGGSVPDAAASAAGKTVAQAETPPGAPPATAGAAATADVPEEEAPDTLPPRVPWRGTMLEWLNSATTTLLGVGQDKQGLDADAAAMTWRLTLQYHVVDLDNWDVSVRTAPTLAVELTNADDTTTEHEPQFLDLPVLGDVSYKVFSDGLWSTVPKFTWGLIFPTWKVSNGRGTYLNTTTRLSLAQTIPLLGADSPALQAFSITGLIRWDHRFGAADTPVNGDLERPRQNLSGGPALSDQLSGSRIASDTLRELISVGIDQPIGPTNLNFGFDFGFSQQFKPALPDASTQCVQISTGPACSEPTVEPTDTLTYYYFSPSITFTPVAELDIGLSYSSSGNPLGQNTLKEDGTRRSFFYAPDAEFGATLTFHPDALFERLTGPARAVAEDSQKKRRAF